MTSYFKRVVEIIAKSLQFLLICYGNWKYISFSFSCTKTSNNNLKFNNGHMQSSGVRCWIYTTMCENNVYWYLVSPYSKLLRPHPFHRSSLRLWWDMSSASPVTCVVSYKVKNTSATDMLDTSDAKRRQINTTTD